MSNANGETQRSSDIPVAPKELIYTDAEKQYHNDVLTLISNAVAERERPRKEFNDMGFSQADNFNINLDLAYVPAAKHKNDIRIVSGMTREKTSSMVSMAKSYDFDVNFQAFDKDDVMLSDLAETATDLVDKTNQLEQWRENRGTVYRGMVSRGTYFTMEVQEFPLKATKTKIPIEKLGSMNVSWDDTSRVGKVEFRTIEIDSKMVILGNINEPLLRKQPFIAVARIIDEAEARSLFGDWDRFKFVPLKANQTRYAGTGGSDVFSYYRDHFKVGDSLSEGEIELLYFMRSLPYGNELAIYLNGVAMLPIKELSYNAETSRYKVSGFPITPISASGEYPIVDWQLERIPGFFYSKGNPAKTKFDEDVLNFWIKFITKKAVRSINPTLGNKSGQILGQQDLSPSNIISNIREGDIFSVLPPEMIQGVTSGEFSFMEMLKKEIDEKTLSREFDGQTLNQHQTATQFMENKKAQLVKLGALVDGIIRGEAMRADLRLRNSIIPFWLKSDKANKKTKEIKLGKAIAQVYDTYTVAKEGRDGRVDTTINIVNSFDGINPYDLLSEQERQLKETGRKKKITLINPDVIDFARTLFYPVVTPRERDNTAMERMLFDQDVVMAKNLFGVGVTNDEALKARFARVRGDSYEDWFVEQGLNQEQALATAMSGMDAGQNGQQPNNIGGMNPASATPPAQMALQ